MLDVGNEGGQALCVLEDYQEALCKKEDFFCWTMETF